MDLEKLYVSQKVHDKLRIRYVEANSPTLSKNIGSTKEKWSILKNLKIKMIK
jgi:hypothetical protein